MYIGNNGSTTHKSIGRKVLFNDVSMEKNVIKIGSSNTNATKIKYEEYQNNRSCEKQVKNYISQSTKIIQCNQIKNSDTQILHQK